MGEHVVPDQDLGTVLGPGIIIHGAGRGVASVETIQFPVGHAIHQTDSLSNSHLETVFDHWTEPRFPVDCDNISFPFSVRLLGIDYYEVRPDLKP